MLPCKFYQNLTRKVALGHDGVKKNITFCAGYFRIFLLITIYILPSMYNVFRPRKKKADDTALLIYIFLILIFSFFYFVCFRFLLFFYFFCFLLGLKKNKWFYPMTGLLLTVSNESNMI